MFSLVQVLTLRSAKASTSPTSKRVLGQTPEARAAALEASMMGSTRSRAYNPTHAWLRRQRQRLHTYGVGDGSQQIRPRYVALLDELMPAWDGKWQRMLKACHKYLQTRGKLPREGPMQVAAVCHVMSDNPQSIYSTCPGTNAGAPLVFHCSPNHAFRFHCIIASCPGPA